MNRVLFKALTKTAMATSRSQHQEFLDTHFDSDPNWKTFKRKLTSPQFVQMVKKDPRADPKLKRYSENNGRHQQAKGVPTFKVPSQTSSKTYTVKKHSDETFSCNCGDWVHKQSTKAKKDKECKHVARVKLRLWAKEQG
jgi:hypothetical protein